MEVSPPTTTADSSADDPVAKRIANELADANARKAAADADKATADAQKAALDVEKTARDLRFPAPTTTRLEGKAEVGEGVGLVADLLAHSLLNDGARELAAQIGPELNPDARILVVTDRELVASDWPYQAVRANLNAHTAAFTDAKSKLNEALGSPPEPPKDEKPEGEAGLEALGAAPGIGMALGGTSALIGGAADIIGWLRADYSVTARETAIGETPLLAAVTSSLMVGNRTVAVDGFALLDDSPLITDFAGALRERNNLKQLIARVKAQVLDPTVRERDERASALKEVATAIAKALGGKPEEAQQKELAVRESELQKRLGALELASAKAAAAITTAEALVTSFDSLTTTITSAPAEGYPPLLAAALRERLHVDDKPYTHVLYANLESAGGETITKRWLWTDPKVRCIGGAQLSFLLLNVADNRIAAAGTRPLLGTARFSVNDGSIGTVQRIPLGAGTNMTAKPEPPAIAKSPAQDAPAS